MSTIFFFALSALLESEIKTQFPPANSLDLHSKSLQVRPIFTTSSITLQERNITQTDGELISQTQSPELPFLFWEKSEIQIEEGD